MTVQRTAFFWVIVSAVTISGVDAQTLGKRRFAPAPLDAVPQHEGMLHAAVQEATTKPHQEQWEPPKRFGKYVAPRRTLSSYASQGGQLTAVADTNRVLYHAFLKMNCQEFTLLNSNYYSCERNYKPLGSTSAAADTASDAPETDVAIGKAKQKVRMALPQLKTSAVLLYSDGRHLIAVDPHDYTTWVFQKSVWARLTHVKK